MKTRHTVLALAGGLWLGTAACLPAQVCTVGTAAGNPAVVDQYGDPIPGYADGANSHARFNFPQAVTVDAAGTVFLADTLNNTIRQMTRIGGGWTVATMAGAGPAGAGSTDGTNSHAQFNMPYSVAVDRDGNLYVADMFNYLIRKVTHVGSNWVVSTIAGLAGTPGTNDGLGSAARFYSPVSVAVDNATNVFVADCNAQVIRKLRPVGSDWVVSTIAGACLRTGSTDGTNNQARFNSPGSITTDSAGRVYVSDWYNSTVRMISPVGTNYVVTTLAGKAGSSGWADGTGGNARFSSPLGGIGLDAAGALYVTDAGMIRKITPAGANWVVTTIAGSSGATGWVNGTGSDVRFYWPQAVAADSAGNLYVADSNNHAIRMGVPASVAPPPLQITREENHVILSWPLSAAGFVPETLSALPAGIAWARLTTGVTISGCSFVLTNHVGPGNAFYRLHLN